MMKERQTEYILRYYLPTPPHFDEEYTKKRFEQLLVFCEETGVKSVMLYVALDPNFYYMPDTLEYTEQTRDVLIPYIQKLKEAGISYQINYQNLIGSVSGGADFSQKLGYEPIVDYKGFPAGGIACPYGTRFREIAGEKLKIWAETKPDVFWMDDDLRMYNHASSTFAVKAGASGSYVDYFCFCDEHIRRFNAKMGTNYTREEIVSGILQEGEPTQMRRDYLAFMNESTVDMAKWIERTIHSVDKNIRIAQMTSGPDAHSAEWRSWKDFYNALCGEHDAIVRPTFGPYRENNPCDFIHCYRSLAHSICVMQENCQKHIEFCPEVENTRFTVWAKSARATTLQLALSAFMGCNNITLSLYDLDGCALLDEPSYKAMLKKEKSYLDTLSALSLNEAQSLGVIIPSAEDAGLRYHLQKGETYSQMSGGLRYIENYFLQAGIPCQYKAIKHLDGKGVTALDGYTANILSDEELKIVLSGNVFLEGKAAEILLARGFGDVIGVKQLQRPTMQTNVEMIYSFAREDCTHIRVPSRIPYRNWYMATLDDKAKVHSAFNTPMGGAFPALSVYENKLGGKVATYFATGNLGDAFFTHHRIALLKNVLGELDESLDRLDCHSFAMLCTKKVKNAKKYHFIANLATDKLETVCLNGNNVSVNLEVYETAVFEENNQILRRVK